MRSLRNRILLTASLVLAVFLGCAGVLLDRAFRDSALNGVEDRLRGRVFMLLGAADFDARDTDAMVGALPDPALATPGSGSYARITAADTGRSWSSASLLGRDLAPPALDPAHTGVWELERVRSLAGERLFALRYGIVWEGEGDHRPRRFIVEAFEDPALYEATVAHFRRSLWTWFAGLSAALLLVQGFNLGRGLRPLAAVEEEVRAIERGERDQVVGSYPSELSGLTVNLNKLLRHHRDSLQRYRNALGDLAHSIKTPLAILRNEFDQGEAASNSTVVEQVERIDRTVQYHLQRAAAAGRSLLAPPRPAAPVIERVVESLRKVYARRGVTIACRVAAGTCFPGDEGDLMEIVGNLGDNACKWAHGQVRIEAGPGEPGAPERGFVLRVIDDGPGIPPEQVERVLQRGARLDESVEGQGIGLAIVRDIVEGAYQGRLQLLVSAQGTEARVELAWA
ncbi:MAG: histidine kinase [Gammaproteobacteria bacterium]|nr:histidine kinase [Gammaproteobacteria bacterium]